MLFDFILQLTEISSVVGKKITCFRIRISKEKNEDHFFLYIFINQNFNLE